MVQYLGSSQLYNITGEMPEIVCVLCVDVVPNVPGAYGGDRVRSSAECATIDAWAVRVFSGHGKLSLLGGTSERGNDRMDCHL